MNTMHTEPSPLIKPESTCTSPSSEKLSYSDNEFCMRCLYSSPSDSDQPCNPQLCGLVDNFEDLFEESPKTSFAPLPTTPENIWDDYTAWDSIRPSMDAQPTWSLGTTPGSSRLPLTSEFSDPWKPIAKPETFAPELFPSFSPTLKSFPAPRPGLPTRSNTSTSTSSHSSSNPASANTTRSASYSTVSTSQTSIDSSTTTHQKRGAPSVGAATKKSKRNKSTAHNDVERRYRSNLNAKIAELSAAVPDHRSSATSENPTGDEMDTESRSEVPCRGPIKKAMVLSRATAYIKVLEVELGSLEAENVTLKKRLAMCGRIAMDEESR